MNCRLLSPCAKHFTTELSCHSTQQHTHIAFLQTVLEFCKSGIRWNAAMQKKIALSSMLPKIIAYLLLLQLFTIIIIIIIHNTNTTTSLGWKKNWNTHNKHNSVRYSLKPIYHVTGFLRKTSEKNEVTLLKIISLDSRNK